MLRQYAGDYRAGSAALGRIRNVLGKLNSCRHHRAGVSPFTMSALMRIAGGGAVLIFLWAAILWAVQS